MISFVWSSKFPFWAGAGGSENYTAGHIRELTRRGIPTRIITLGHGLYDGRADFPDITFKAIHSKQQLSLLDDTLVFVTYPLKVRTKRQAYAIMHCPPSSCGMRDPLFDEKGIAGKKLIAASRFSALMWEKDLGLPTGDIPVAYPFADKHFAHVKRTSGGRGSRRMRILFGGRLTPDKGVYTLMTAMHIIKKMKLPVDITATTAGGHSDDGQIIQALFQAHPDINLIPAQRDSLEMSRLMSHHDIVVMPSSDLLWKELFGMVSVEAQHAGCRVVAADTGGLPETDCGGLTLIKPDDPVSLAEGLAAAVKLGPLSIAERKRASNVFTVEESVDSLLEIMERQTEKTGTTMSAKPGLRRLQPGVLKVGLSAPMTTRR